MVSANVNVASGSASSRTLSVRRVGKHAVQAAGRWLPASLFERLVRFARAVYGGAGRMAFRLRLERDRWTDHDAYVMGSAIQDVLPYTWVGVRGLEATYRAAERMNREQRPGAFVELGVARGGCAALLARLAFADAALPRRVWLFDSFEGLPDPTADDLDPSKGAGTGEHVTPLTRGSCLGAIEDVQWLLFDRFALPRERMTLVKGWFQDTLPIHGRSIGSIAVLRIDGDWYESTKVCLEHLYDQVVAGGAVIVDDYESCFGCSKAVDEFLDARHVSADIRLDGRGGCFFFKP